VAIPDSINSNASSFSLQIAKEFSAVLQAQDQPTTPPKPFDEVLASANAMTDTVEILHADPASNANPDSSTLFQAHSGAIGSNQASATLADRVLSMQDLPNLRVSGIDATTAAGAFADGHSSQPEAAQSVSLSGVEMNEGTRFPAVSGAEDAHGTYGPHQNPRIGLKMDLKG
jgi:hypothetical protein